MTDDTPDVSPAPDSAPAPDAGTGDLEKLQMSRPKGFKAVRTKELREAARDVSPETVEYVRGLQLGGETRGSAAFSCAAGAAHKGIDLPAADLAWLLLEMKKEAKKQGRGELAAAVTLLEEIYAVLAQK